MNQATTVERRAAVFNLWTPLHLCLLSAKLLALDSLTARR